MSKTIEIDDKEIISFKDEDKVVYDFVTGYELKTPEEFFFHSDYPEVNHHLGALIIKCWKNDLLSVETLKEIMKANF